MTKKRFTSQRTDDYNFSDILDNGNWIGSCHVDCEDDFVNKLNELNDENKKFKEENEQLKIEIHMLKITIGRNEAYIQYIQRMKHKGGWK